MAAIIVIKHRHDTASAWTTANPTLAVGEFGFETDTGQFKIGTGATAWISLGYAAISTAAGDTRYIVATLRGAANGVASLDAGGKIPASQLPAFRIAKVTTVANQAARLAQASNDDMMLTVQTDTAATYVLPGGADPSVNGNWTMLPSASTAGLEQVSNKDAANGYAGLDGTGKLKVAEFPVIDGGTA